MPEPRYLENFDLSEDENIRETQIRRIVYNVQLSREEGVQKRLGELQVDQDLEHSYDEWDRLKKKEQKEKIVRRKSIVGGITSIALMFIIGMTRFTTAKFFIAIFSITFGILFLRLIFKGKKLNFEKRIKSGFAYQKRGLEYQAEVLKKANKLRRKML